MSLPRPLSPQSIQASQDSNATKPADFTGIDSATEAAEVRIDNATKTFTLVWGDTHRSVYPWWYLRGLCPCASCQGHGGPARFVAQDVTELGDVDEVGNYALRLIWNEEHKTGIYSFTYLRDLCPCASCQQSLGPNHPINLLNAKQQERLHDLGNTGS
jgi:DUF971 family protein